MNLTKQLSEGFKRCAYWSEYKSKTESENLGNDNLTRFYLDASFQGVKRLFVLAFNNTTEDAGNNPINYNPITMIKSKRMMKFERLQQDL